ncbi:MAG: hypothetical protein ACRDIC_02330 [bacterium]
MVQAMVHGIALFHVERKHPGGDDHHALILKLRRLRALDLDSAAIGQIRPIYRVYKSEVVEYEAYQYLIEVTADSQEKLKTAFKQIDKEINCHIDGFGF